MKGRQNFSFKTAHENAKTHRINHRALFAEMVKKYQPHKRFANAATCMALEGALVGRLERLTTEK